MYLLGTQEVVDLVKRDQKRPILVWLNTARPGRNDLFVSAISLGQLAQEIELTQQPARDQWRRVLQVARRGFESQGSIINVDMEVVDAWASNLRGRDLTVIDPVTGNSIQLGEDDRLVIATAIARGYSLVTQRTPALDEVTKRSKLTIIEP
jgi:predicted nucleic acid-binding protein